MSYGLGAAVGGGVIQAIQPEQIVLQTAGGLKIVPLFPAAGTAPVVAGIGTNARKAAYTVGPFASSSVGRYTGNDTMVLGLKYNF